MEFITLPLGTVDHKGGRVDRTAEVFGQTRPRALIFRTGDKAFLGVAVERIGTEPRRTLNGRAGRAEERPSKILAVCSSELWAWEEPPDGKVEILLGPASLLPRSTWDGDSSRVFGGETLCRTGG
ncbi:hypothetical protein IWQ61_005438 [Dispira simplex]|nr:hypothetical protein IWQ61_005438 [Dispira simplex]